MANSSSRSTENSSTSSGRVQSVAEFERLRDDASRLLVDFYAEWCGPCHLMDDAVDTVARESDAAVVKVDVEEVPQLALQYDVHGLPAFLIFHDGAVRERLVGMQEADALLDAFA